MQDPKDSDLDDLFDSIAFSHAKNDVEQIANPTSPVKKQLYKETNRDDFFQEIGLVARALHNNLFELGYDKTLGEVVDDDIPDVRSRLDYVIEKTSNAANATMDSAEKAKDMQNALSGRAREMAIRWGNFIERPGSVDEFKSLVSDGLLLFSSIERESLMINDMLTSIIIAQDYQDLTGQVIKKVVDIAGQVESQLVHLLITSAPPEKKSLIDKDFLDGPSLKTTSDNHSSQSQVDDLLASLGF